MGICSGYGYDSGGWLPPGLTLAVVFVAILGTIGLVVAALIKYLRR
jgi:hypothetical protein